MTLFFAVTTSCCLIVLAFFAARMDDDARQRVDAGLLTQAQHVSVGVNVDATGFQFGSPNGEGSGAGLTAIGSVPTAFIDTRGIEYASPDSDALPRAAVIDTLFARATNSQHAAYITAADVRGRDLRWVARPIGDAGSAVVLVGTANTFRLTTAQVHGGLGAAVLGLAALSTLVGHVLSGRLMRPAVRELEQQEQFLREAAHELRTPLTTLTLLTEAGIREPHTAPETLEQVHRGLGKTTTLVANLLLRARADLDPTALVMRPLRLDQLVDVTLSELDTAGRVELHLTRSTVTGNADLLAQAIRNLVENALRYAPTGPITVTVRENAFSVTDTGPGLGNRSEPNASVAGTGSGLAIVRWITDVHQGSFTLQSNRRRTGMTATLTFPVGFKPTTAGEL